MERDGARKDSASRGSSERLIIEANGVSYECLNRTGKGSFGVVYKAVTRETGQIVAIKRVLQDPRYKNRELQIMKMVKHPNTVELINSFYEKNNGEVYLNLVLSFVPKNLYEVSMYFAKRKDRMPVQHIKLYIYQLCRSLGYIHSLGICHRDIKPQNLLINPETQELRLCDFGSAKILIRGEPNVSYICSRYYRAPELIFGAADYTPAIDVWSSGCVMAELLLGEPIFAGESGIDQLVEIIKVLGTPSREEIRAMNPDYQDYKQFPPIYPHPWAKVLPPFTPTEVVDVISAMLVYTPDTRLSPLEICAHHCFDELREQHSNMSSLEEKPDGHALPLLDFNPEELFIIRKSGLQEKLAPKKRESSSTKSNSASPAAPEESNGSASPPNESDE